MHAKQKWVAMTHPCLLIPSQLIHSIDAVESLTTYFYGYLVILKRFKFMIIKKQTQDLIS